LIPYHFSQKLGDFKFSTLSSLTHKQIENLMKKSKALHRFPSKMSKNFHLALATITSEYGGDASNIWKKKPSSSPVVYRFL